MKDVQRSPSKGSHGSDGGRVQQLKMELKQRQDGLDEERCRWQEEKESMQREIADALSAKGAASDEARRLQAECDTLVSKAEAAECLAAAAKAAASESVAAASSGDATVKRMEAELVEKAAEIGSKEAELRAAQAELEQKTVDLEEARATITSQEEELKRLRSDNDRLGSELSRKTQQYEEAWNSLTELRGQHSKLRQEHEDLQLSKQKSETSYRERELALEGLLRDHDLRIKSIEQDNAEQAERLLQMDEFRERAEYADRMLEPLEKRIQELHDAFDAEQALRKRYHNQLQDAKGAIRVYARIRPIVPREAGQEAVIRKIDAFNMELDFKDGKK